MTEQVGNGVPKLTESERIPLRAVFSTLPPWVWRSATAPPHPTTSRPLGAVEGTRDRSGELRNVLHIPSDAGPHARAIEAILRHIPDGWGRWLNVDAGWYPLVITTDHRLAEHDPGYVVHRIKEKYGALRYYCWPGIDDVAPDLLDAMDAITDEARRHL